VIHIGFLDFDLFPEEPEFYATYMMQNVKKQYLYSSKFKLSVVNLKQVELATEEDRKYNIDYWARLFKAKTWEEIQMLAKNDEYIKEAADFIYKANADDIVRQQCRAREEAERRERTLERDKKLLQQENDGLKQENDGLKQENDELKQENDELKQAIGELKQENDELKQEIDKFEGRITSLECKFEELLNK